MNENLYTLIKIILINLFLAIQLSIFLLIKGQL